MYYLHGVNKPIILLPQCHGWKCFAVTLTSEWLPSCIFCVYVFQCLTWYKRMIINNLQQFPIFTLLKVILPIPQLLICIYVCTIT